jgi:hypothetical protein
VATLVLYCAHLGGLVSSITLISPHVCQTMAPSYIQPTLPRTLRTQATFVSILSLLKYSRFFGRGLTSEIGGSSAVERDQASVCVPGYTCSGPGVYGYYVCLLGTSAASTTAAASTTVVTTILSITTTSSTRVSNTLASSKTSFTTITSLATSKVSSTSTKASTKTRHT